MSTSLLDKVEALAERVAKLEAFPAKVAVPMRLPCPSCGALHLDVGEFATKPHHTHSCQECGMTWRPAVVHTVGVQFLPGFKNAPSFEELVARVGPLPMTALASAGEATVPPGWKLAQGWSFGAHGTYDWQCWSGLDDYGEEVGETCKLRGPYLFLEGGSASKGACAAHAVEMGALVKDEPPAEQPSRQETPGSCKFFWCGDRQRFCSSACHDRAKAKAAERKNLMTRGDDGRLHSAPPVVLAQLAPFHALADEVAAIEAKLAQAERERDECRRAADRLVILCARHQLEAEKLKEQVSALLMRKTDEPAPG